MKKTIIIIGTIVLAVAIAGMYKFNYLSSQPGYDVDGNKITNKPDFRFVCSDEAVGTFSTTFKGKNTEKIAYLSLGDSVTKMQYVPSGSGEKYENTEESLVFWEKGGMAFIEKDGSIVHSDCELISQIGIDQNKSVNDSLLGKSLTLNMLSADSSSIPTVVLNAPEYMNNYSILAGDTLDEGTISLDKKHATVVSKVSADQSSRYFIAPFVQKSEINGSNTYLALFRKNKNGAIEHLDSIPIGKDVNITSIEDEIQMVSVEFMSDETLVKERFFVSETEPFLKKESMN